MKRKIIITLVVIAGLLVLTILTYVIVHTAESMYYSPKNPETAFKRLFRFELPDSAVIENFQREKSGSDCFFKFKIALDENDYVIVKNEFEKNLSETGFREMSDGEFIPPGFKNTCEWWDMNEDDIIEKYCKVRSGRKNIFGIGEKSVWSYVFFTQNNKGQYFLYIVG